MKILVTGGRSYANKDLVYKTLDEFWSASPSGFLLIQGGSTGADQHARSWAASRGRPCCTYTAPWDTLGLHAGPIRNRWMIEYDQPDFGMAFPRWAWDERYG